MNKGRLFVGSCFALISTAVAFAVVSAIIPALKAQFILSNLEVGYIAGAAIWGFTLSIYVLGPLVDALGMRTLMRFALLCHAAGPLIMILAAGAGGGAFWMLFFGALIIALGNGTVEAACNPLVATLYPDEKTKKLNQFHVWFPGGILIGGVASYLLMKALAEPGGDADWRLKLGLVFVPTVIYGILFARQAFPPTERVQSGITFEGMVKATLLRPLFLVLLLCMCITASLELGPNRWIPAVLEAGNIPGILVGSAILSGIGLYWFSFAESTAMAFLSATVFAIGVCYFWPTMLGVVSERVPRSGALGLALMGGTGMLMVGVVTTPQMGRIADRYLHEDLPVERTREVLKKVVEVYPPAAEAEPETIKVEILAAVEKVSEVLDAGDVLPEFKTADAMREAIKNAPSSGAARAVVDELGEVLTPADFHGGRMSFRYVAPFSLVIIVVFGLIFLRDRARGGYKAESLIQEGEGEA